jgi:hypothetical protein
MVQTKAIAEDLSRLNDSWAMRAVKDAFEGMKKGEK